ncbi:MAG: sugar ABC transporter ATP-binding protein [Pirellulales bacterium]|nr:sugar ABC transporter ATP-binding protein [Pirellulales bacterium]
MPPLISIEGVSKRFPGVTALDDVSIDIAGGELHAIVGENGAGKSTLMKILAGVIGDFDGQLLLRNRPVRFAEPRAAEAAGVSIIHQELNLVEQLSVAANIFLGREQRNRLGLLNERAMEREAAALLGEWECQISPRQLVGTLRVGDQQLIEIAKALSLNSEILIMDEPTSALSEAEVTRLDRVISRLRSRGVTILYISHKMEEVFRLADRITVLRDGKLVKTVARSETSPREVTHLMVGREIENARVGGDRQASVPVLEVHDLSLPWPGHARGWRFKDIRFSVHRGEIVGIAGLLGAGRTELLECLFGASGRPPVGEILLDGQPVQFDHPADARAAGVALVTEDRKRLGLFSHLTVAENITLCSLHEISRRGIISRRRERQAADATISQLAVKTPSRRAAVTSLSGGNQQKCIIGRWLLTKPKVLLLDDPTRGVDVGAKSELYRLIDGLCREGLGVIVTSSELPELLTLCNRILVLCEGRLTGEFNRAEATEQIIMEAATKRQ